MQTTYITIFVTIIGVLIVIYFLIKSYKESQRILKWHQDLHRQHAWASRPPKQSWICTLLNTILFIPKK